MQFVIILLMSLVGFNGCATKGTFDMFALDEPHQKAVEQLRSVAIVKSFETKALVHTVYLNPIYPDKYNDGEYFIGAVYFERDNRDVKKWDLNAHGYTLTLNGKKATIIEELKESDQRRALIPVQNNWNKYYFIRFDLQPEGALMLLLENNQTGQAVLGYQKGK